MSPPFLLSTHMVGPQPTGPLDRNLTLLYTLLPKLFLELDFVCSSRATCLVIYSGIRRNTYSHFSESLSHTFSDIERLPIRLKLLIAPSYLALDDFLEFQLERYSYVHSWDTPS